MEAIQSLLQNNTGAPGEIKMKTKLCACVCVYVHVRGKIFVLSHTWSVGATEKFTREVQEPLGHALPKEHRSQGSLVQLPPSTSEEAEAPPAACW